MEPIQGVLDYNDFKKIEEAEAILARKLEELKRAENCGINCVELRNMHSELSKIFENYRSNYKP